MANQPSPPSAAPPPDVPHLIKPDVALVDYLRRFSLWCREGFSAKLDRQSAAGGIFLQAYDTPAGQTPAVFLLRVNSAGVLSLASMPFGSHGAPGAAIPIGVIGTVLGDDAPAGWIGEFKSSVVTSGPTLSTGVSVNVTSLPLTPGDWDVYGDVFFSAASGAATFTGVQAGLTIVSATQPGVAVNASRELLNAPFNTSTNQQLSLKPCRISISAPATAYLVALAIFGTGTATAFGSLLARRAR